MELGVRVVISWDLDNCSEKELVEIVYIVSVYVRVFFEYKLKIV